MMPSKDEQLAYGFSTAFLNKNKAIKSLVNKAIDQGWTSTRFIDELRKTKWWKSRTDAQKRYEALRVENPGELQGLLRTARTSVANMAIRLGVQLSAGQRDAVALSWVKNSLDEEDVQRMIGAKYRFRAGGKGAVGRHGVGGVARGQLDEMFRNMGIQLSGKSLTKAAREVVMGRRTVQDYESYARTRAQAMFPTIANDIKEGRTVREVLDPYLTIASQELGIPVSTMDTNWSKWMTPISGDHRWSTDEWVREIRSNKRYGYDQTQNARREAAVFSNQLMQMLGAR